MAKNKFKDAFSGSLEELMGSTLKAKEEKAEEEVKAAPEANEEAPVAPAEVKAEEKKTAAPEKKEPAPKEEEVKVPKKRGAKKLPEDRSMQYTLRVTPELYEKLEVVGKLFKTKNDYLVNLIEADMKKNFDKYAEDAERIARYKK